MRQASGETVDRAHGRVETCAESVTIELDLHPRWMVLPSRVEIAGISVAPTAPLLASQQNRRVHFPSRRRARDDGRKRRGAVDVDDAREVFGPTMVFPVARVRHGQNVDARIENPGMNLTQPGDLGPSAIDSFCAGVSCSVRAELLDRHIEHRFGRSATQNDLDTRGATADPIEVLTIDHLIGNVTTPDSCERGRAAASRPPSLGG